MCGMEIVEFIESRPAERHDYYRLLNPDLCFYPLLFRNLGILKQLPEFQQCDTIMHEDPIISRHLDVIVGSTDAIGARMETWNYLFHILDKLIIAYFIQGDEYDESLYNKLYCDLESLFYNEYIPMNVIAPLHNFECEVDRFNLDAQISIRKITQNEKNLILKIVGDISLGWPEISTFEYVIEYSTYYTKKLIGVSTPVKSPNEEVSKIFRNVICAMRLYKTGSIGFSFIISKAVLDTAIKGGATTSSVPLEVTYGNNYKLTRYEIDSLLTFWKKMKVVDLTGIDNNDNFNLAFSRFNSSYNKPRKEDKFIDLAICYEALFSKKGDSHSSVSHKLALRFARLISEEFCERMLYFRDMKNLYDERSNIMHGNSSKKLNLEKMEYNIRKAIVAYLESYDPKITHNDIIDTLDFN